MPSPLPLLSRLSIFKFRFQDSGETYYNVLCRVLLMLLRSRSLGRSNTADTAPSHFHDWQQIWSVQLRRNGILFEVVDFKSLPDNYIDPCISW